MVEPVETPSSRPVEPSRLVEPVETTGAASTRNASTTSQVTTPAANGRIDVEVNPGRDISAASATAPISRNTRLAAIRLRCDSTPASAPRAMMPNVTPATRIGLSLRPTTWISDSATGPGVFAMTTSATAWIGVARALRAFVTAWLTAMPDSPASAPASATYRR